jgi:hypothetical protein
MPSSRAPHARLTAVRRLHALGAPRRLNRGAVATPSDARLFGVRAAAAATRRLTAEGSWDDCRREIVEMMARRNEAANGILLVAAEYLLVVAARLP